MRTKRWQDWANLVLGAWIFVSPWVLGYSATVAALNAWIVGAGLVLFVVIDAWMPAALEEVVNALFGIWLIVSPFVLGFDEQALVALHTVLAGILATAFAIWAMTNEQGFYQRWRSGRLV